MLAAICFGLIGVIQFFVCIRCLLCRTKVSTGPKSDIEQIVKKYTKSTKTGISYSHNSAENYSDLNRNVPFLNIFHLAFPLTCTMSIFGTSFVL